MRCPKCGYITFDRVERCGKCANDLTAVAAQLRGPMAKVTAPMFLGGLLQAAGADVVEAEPAELDLSEEALDLGAVEEEAISLAEEAPAVAEEAEEEVAIEMPSLSGIDVSDLVPPAQEEAAPVETPEEQEEIGGIAMPEMDLSEAPEPAAAPPMAEEEEDLSLNFDLTGGESRGEAELEAQEEAAGGVLDLADLLGTVSDEPVADELGAGGGEADDLSLLLEDEPPTKPASAPEQLSLSLESAGEEGGLDLTLDADAPPVAPPASEPAQPDIPDLGLTLESDGEEEPAS